MSPEPEFNGSVKEYIKSKLIGDDYRNGINITVISDKPIDEKRFFTAKENWIRTDSIIFKAEEKSTVRTLVGSILFGFAMLVSCLAIEEKYVMLQYSLMPIMGSIALGDAASILIKDMPMILVKKRIMKEMKNNNIITFEYGSDAD